MSALAKAQAVELAAAPEPRQTGLLPWEDQGLFVAARAEFIAAYAPVGPIEASLVDRLIWCDWRRRRLKAAEAAVHVAHAVDRAGDGASKTKTLKRAGVSDPTIREETSITEILQETDADDADAVAAVTEGIADLEAALDMLASREDYQTCLERLDGDARDWWADALKETDDGGALKYQADAGSLKRFLTVDALPWRRRWLALNAARPAIRAQAIAESLDPVRISQLWDMEARLDRQFEKSLSMLIRLQEIRGAGRL